MEGAEAGALAGVRGGTGCREWIIIINSIGNLMMLNKHYTAIVLALLVGSAALLLFVGAVASDRTELLIVVSLLGVCVYVCTHLQVL